MPEFPAKNQIAPDRMTILTFEIILKIEPWNAPCFYKKS